MTLLAPAGGSPSLPQPAGPPASTAGPAGASPPARRRRLVTGLVLAVGVVAVVVTALTAGPDRSFTAPLDPDNPGPSGAQALARVLDDDGVDVDIVRSADALDAARIDRDTTVVVTSTDQLGTSTAERLVDRIGDGHLVVVDAGPTALDALGARPTADGTTSETSVDLTGSCPSAFGGLLDGLRLQVDAADGYPSTGDACFATGSGTGSGTNIVATTSMPASTSSTTGTMGVVLFGAGEALSNQRITRADDAAIALRLLGHEHRLVWYVPTADDLTAGDAVSATSLLPRALGPLLFLLVLVVLGVMVWRGRRLGPLATEPLPVVVRAAETTHSRGRLYRRSGDRVHAARVLRAASRARLAGVLGLGAGVDDSVVVAATARRLALSDGEVALVLADSAPAPQTDHELIALAARLAELEREARHP